MKKVLSIILCAVVAISCLSFSVSAKKVKVTAPKIKSVTNTDIDTQKIKWTKVSGVKGYQLYCKAGSGKFKKIKTLGKNTTSFTNKKLKEETKYFYKVRAYKKVSGKTKYSKFSNQSKRKTTNYLTSLYNPYRINGLNNFIVLFNGQDYFYMSGNKFNNGIKIKYDWSESILDYNLKGKYRYMQITYGDISTKEEETLDILADDEIIVSFNIKPGDLAKTNMINLENANKLEFRIWGRYGEIGLANIKLYK